MKIRQTTSFAVLTCLLSGCVPVPSYSVDPYAGSLKQCLDIQGTYESTNFYTPSDKNWRGAALTERARPVSLWRKIQKSDFKYTDATQKGHPYLRIWMSFKFMDDQRVDIGVFNELGQEVSIVYDMKKPSREGFVNREDEQFTCNASSWQRSYTRATAAEGRGFKDRDFEKLTKLADGSLKREGGGFLERSFGLIYA